MSSPRPKNDLRPVTIKRDICGRMPAVGDDVIIAPKKVEVTQVSRSNGRQPRIFRDRQASLGFDEVDATLPVSETYFGLAA